MAKRFDFGGPDDPIFIGEDRTFRCQLVKRDSTGAEVVEGDVSANAYIFTLKQDPDDASAEFTKDSGVGNGITFAAGDTAGYPKELAGANTVAVIAVDDTDTDSLTEEPYYFDVKRTDDGSEAVIAYGTIKFTKGISA